jgi:hypothetical protein
MFINFKKTLVRPLVALFKPFFPNAFYKKWALDLDDDEEYIDENVWRRYQEICGCSEKLYTVMALGMTLIATGICMALVYWLQIQLLSTSDSGPIIAWALCGVLVLVAMWYLGGAFSGSKNARQTRARGTINTWLTRFFFFYMKFLSTSTIDTLLNNFFTEAIPFPCDTPCMTARYWHGLDNVIYHASIKCWSENDERSSGDAPLPQYYGEPITKNMPYIHVSLFRKAVYVPNTIAFVIFFFGYPALLQFYADNAHMFVKKATGAEKPTKEDYELCKSRYPTSFGAIIDEFSVSGVNYVSLFTWLEMVPPLIKMMADRINWRFEILICVFHLLLGILYYIINPFPKPSDRIFRAISNFASAGSAILAILPHMDVEMAEGKTLVTIGIGILILVGTPFALWCGCHWLRKKQRENEAESDSAELWYRPLTTDETYMIEKFNKVSSMRLMTTMNVLLALAGFAYGWFYGILDSESTASSMSGALRDEQDLC